jgi:hypothetical protein
VAVSPKPDGHGITFLKKTTMMTGEAAAAPEEERSASLYKILVIGAGRQPCLTAPCPIAPRPPIITYLCI